MTSVNLGDLKLRAARRDDIEAIVALEAESFRPPWSRALIERHLNDAKTVVLIAQSETIVGYAMGWTIGEEGELDRIAVTTMQRGRGIGARLLQMFGEEAARRGARTLFLEVRAANFAAQQLYRNAGFALAGRRPRYYDDGEDALIYRLTIND